ncbi:MAG: hypothetical protein QOH47_3409 [Sphingomonadales bacterium]|jgi:hypothetical protein|nr:hypothetical protein [Sphingomonadales bacterium]
MNLDTLIASAVAQHYRLDPVRTGRTLFPDIGPAGGADPRLTLL